MLSVLATGDPNASTFLGPFLQIVWPMFIVLVVLAVASLVVGVIRRRRLARSGILEIDHLSGKVFEEYLELLFRRLGYRVERTRFVGDDGGDLVVRKDGVRTIVQAKRWNKSVGIKAVQEAVAAKAVYDCTEAMVVSNSRYTKAAIHLASKNRVVLWDRDMLIRQLTSAHAKEALSSDAVTAVQEPIPALSINEAPLADVAVCKTCARVLTAGERQYCHTNAQRFGGEMLCFRHQRASRVKA